MRKKTVRVAFVKTEANVILANPDVSQEAKKGVASLLESILHESNNYLGFGYIAWANGGCERWMEETGSDHTKTHEYLGEEYDRIYY